MLQEEIYIYGQITDYISFHLKGEIFTSRFHPSGETLASAGFDRLICKFIYLYW